MKIPYNILIQIKMSVRPYFKGFTLIFFFYNCRKQDFTLMRLLSAICFKRNPLPNIQAIYQHCGRNYHKIMAE